MIWKKIKGNVTQSFLRKPTHSAVETKFKNKTTDAYINSTAVSRTNAELDKHNFKFGHWFQRINQKV